MQPSLHFLTENPSIDSLRLRAEIKEGDIKKYEKFRADLEFTWKKIKNQVPITETNDHYKYLAKKPQIYGVYRNMVIFHSLEKELELTAKYVLMNDSVNVQYESSMNKFVNGKNAAISNKEMNNAETCLLFHNKADYLTNNFIKFISGRELIENVNYYVDRFDVNKDIYYDNEGVQQNHFDTVMNTNYNDFNVMFSNHPDYGEYLRLSFKKKAKANKSMLLYNKTLQLQNVFKTIIDESISRYEEKQEKNWINKNSKFNFYINDGKIYERFGGKIKNDEFNNRINKNFNKEGVMDKLMVVQNMDFGSLPNNFMSNFFKSESSQILICVLYTYDDINSRINEISEKFEINKSVLKMISNNLIKNNFIKIENCEYKLTQRGRLFIKQAYPLINNDIKKKIGGDQSDN